MDERTGVIFNPERVAYVKEHKRKGVNLLSPRSGRAKKHEFDVRGVVY